ncbi:MAG: PQQ-dependent dehydrogenase, methanol/ethanol family, partial [Gammaproteobacteria bacterium]
MKKTSLKGAIISCLAGAAIGFGGVAMAKHLPGVSDADVLNDATTTEDVVSYGLGSQGQRFSPLTKVNTDTIKHLVPAWTFSYGGEKQR